MKSCFPNPWSSRRAKPTASLLVAFAALALVFTAVSCASSNRISPRVVAVATVWPAPPDEARIRWLRNISTPVDIGITPSTWSRLAGLITGEAPTRENLDKPFGITTDETGAIFVADTGNSSIVCIDPVRKEWRRLRVAGKTRFLSPVAIARQHGVFYVADSELGKVLAFNDLGAEVFTITQPLQRPTGLAVSGGLLFVVDSQLHGVFAFDWQGRSLFHFGQRGAGPGEFNFPTHIASDQRGHLLVTDAMNNRVQVFDAKGTFLAEIGKAGDVPGHFGRPKGVAVDSFGHVYVVDAMFDNVQVFDLGGRLLLNWGGGGTEPGQFGVPAGIAMGEDNVIYVADSYNHRVQVFQYIGAP